MLLVDIVEYYTTMKYALSVFLDIDDCKNYPCVHGKCVDGVNNFTCTCLPGYEGILCDIGK